MRLTSHRVLSAGDREEAAKALLYQHLSRPAKDLKSNTPDGSPYCPPAPDDGLHEELAAFLGRYPGAAAVFYFWLVHFGGKDWTLFQAARRVRGMTGGRAKRLVHAVLTELMARMARSE